MNTDEDDGYSSLTIPAWGWWTVSFLFALLYMWAALHINVIAEEPRWIAFYKFALITGVAEFAWIGLRKAGYCNLRIRSRIRALVKNVSRKSHHSPA